jgi:branched-chain amino acid transport system substrate-binding protein
MINRRNFSLAIPSFAAIDLINPFNRANAQTNVVKFGQSASLSGGQATYGKDVRDGIRAAFEAASRNDKSLGMQYELVTMDDAGDKEKCKANVKTLIESSVVSLIGLTSGAGAEASISIAEEARVVMLGTASGNMGIRHSKFSMPAHVRAGYADEYKAMVRYVKDFGMKRVGYVYLKDTSAANQQAMTAALEGQGVNVTLSVPMDRNAKSFEAEAKELLNAKLDCVLFMTNAGPIEKIIDLMSNQNYLGTYFASSFAGQALLDAMAPKGKSFIMSQVMPRPTALAVTVVKQYQQDLLAIDANAKPGYTSLEGYIAGRIAVEAARSAAKGGSVTAQRFKDKLQNLNTDLGGYQVKFNQANMQGSHFVDIVAMGRNGRIIG